MSQGSIHPDENQNGTGYATAVRTALDGVATEFAGASAPSVGGEQPFAHQLWRDTTTGLRKRRDASNNNWIAEGLLNGFLGNGVCVNLKVNVLSSDPTQAVITCDAITIDGVYCTAVSETMDTNNAAGANGIDTGAWAIDTWYALYLICNDDASLVAPLASLSATSPTMPSGYTRKRRIGWVRSRTATATNLINMRQVGPVAEWIEDQAILLNQGIVQTPETDVDLSTRVPPGVTRVFVSTLVESNGSLGAGVARELLLRPNGDTGGSLPYGRVVGPSTSSQFGDWIDTDASRVIEYKMSGANALGTIRVRRWWDSAVQ